MEYLESVKLATFRVCEQWDWYVGRFASDTRTDVAALAYLGELDLVAPYMERFLGARPGGLSSNLFHYPGQPTLSFVSPCET